MTRSDPAMVLLDTMLEGAFRGRGWQGATLSGALRGVTAARALRRPGPRRRCIWEHVLHAAYWKYAVRRVLDPSSPEGFGRTPSNWPRLPLAPSERLWRADRALLAEEHERVLAAARALTPARFDQRPSPKHKWTIATYLAGVAAHDCYHLGQIQLIKRLV